MRRMAVDESTDVSDKMLDQKEFCEDLLGVTPLQTSARREDVYLAIKML